MNTVNPLRFMLYAIIAAAVVYVGVLVFDDRRQAEGVGAQHGDTIKIR